MRIVEYTSDRKQDFVDLNTWWIERYFGRVEQADRNEFDNVDNDIARGAMVYFALDDDGTALATCMAVPRGDDEWEIAKLGSSPNREHTGCGKAVFEKCVAWAESKGAKRVFILTNSSLHTAIHIYESHGFKRFELDDFGYDRGDYALEKFPDSITYPASPSCG